MSNYLYPAIAAVRLASGEPRYVGTVRDPLAPISELWRCTHRHASRSEAARCAEAEYNHLRTILAGMSY